MSALKIKFAWLLSNNHKSILFFSIPFFLRHVNCVFVRVISPPGVYKFKTFNNFTSVCHWVFF